MATADDKLVRAAAENVLEMDDADRRPMAQVFGDPGDVTLVPMDALDNFRRKKVIAFRIKWLKALEEGAQRELRALEEGSADNGRPRSR